MDTSNIITQDKTVSILALFWFANFLSKSSLKTVDLIQLITPTCTDKLNLNTACGYKFGLDPDVKMAQMQIYLQLRSTSKYLIL